MENKDDLLLKAFLGEAKKDIEDRGFSNRVTRLLPAKKQKTGWIVPLFVCIGLVITLLLVDVKELFLQISDVATSLPVIYLLAGVMAYPIVFLLYYYLFYDRKRVL